MLGFYGGTPGHSNIISLKAAALTKDISDFMSIGEKIIIESDDVSKNGTIWEKVGNRATSTATSSGADVTADFSCVGRLKGVKGDKNSVYQILRNVNVSMDEYPDPQDPSDSFIKRLGEAIKSALSDDTIWQQRKTILVNGQITQTGTSSQPFSRLVILKNYVNAIVDDLGAPEEYKIKRVDDQKYEIGVKTFNFKTSNIAGGV